MSEAIEKRDPEGMGIRDIEGTCNDTQTTNVVNFRGHHNRGLQIAQNYGTVHSGVPHSEIEGISDGVQRLLADTSNQAERGELERKKARFLDSLRFKEINRRQNNIEESHRNTFSWIFAEQSLARENSFTEWLRKDGQIYWIRGKAGSGKSTLMKFIAADTRTSENLAAWAQEMGPCLIAAFYFWLSGSDMQRSMKGFLCSLTRDLLVGDDRALLETLKSERFQEKQEVDDWSVSELQVLLEHTILSITQQRKLCIFIDGIDEFDTHAATSDIGEFLDLITRLTDSKNVKACISSRPETYIERRFSRFPSIRLEDRTSTDLRMVILDRLKSALGESFETGHEEDLALLESIIMEKADGVFLWVHLALKDVVKGIYAEDQFNLLLARIQRLPPGMESLFKDMLKRSDPLYHAEAQVIFQFHSFFYMSVFHMVIATRSDIQRQYLSTLKAQPPAKMVLACQTLEKCIVSRSAGLLEIYDTLDSPHSSEDGSSEDGSSEDGSSEDGLLTRYLTLEIRFFHRTARDFLLGTHMGQQWMGPLASRQNEKTKELDVARAYLVELIQFGRLRYHEYPDFLEKIIQKVVDCDATDQIEVIEKVQRVCYNFGMESVKCMSECAISAADIGCLAYVYHFVEGNISRIRPFFLGYLVMHVLTNIRSERIDQTFALADWLIDKGADLFKAHVYGGCLKTPFQHILCLILKDWRPMEDANDEGICTTLPELKRFFDLMERLSSNRVDWEDITVIEFLWPSLEDISIMVPDSSSLHGALPPESRKIKISIFLWVALSTRLLYRLAMRRLDLLGFRSQSKISVPMAREDSMYAVRYMLHSERVRPRSTRWGKPNFKHATSLGTALKEVILPDMQSKADFSLQVSKFKDTFIAAIAESEHGYIRDPLNQELKRLGLGRDNRVEQLLYTADSDRENWWRTGWFEGTKLTSPPKSPGVSLIDRLRSEQS